MFGQKFTNINKMLQCRILHCAKSAPPDSAQLNTVASSVLVPLGCQAVQLIVTGNLLTRPCLDTKFASQISLWKKKIPITSKCWHMHGVQNIDEIKN
jgi:hypothetical protein